ncbi:MAG: hypothetical protein ACKVYV_08340 [Limisphaerales bacterium]
MDPGLVPTLALGVPLAVAICGGEGPTNRFDFDTDPATYAAIVRNHTDAVWQAGGGNPGGFLALTGARPGEYTAVLFDDFTEGKVIAAFGLSAEVRLGAGIALLPGGGFSLCLARDGDPAIAGLEAGSLSTHNVAGGRPEAGPVTGLAISLDPVAGDLLPDGPDAQGIVVRVDNVTVLRAALPTPDGACADATSLQTGPRDGGGDADALCWAPLHVALSEVGELTVRYKRRTLLDRVAIAFSPSRLRLLAAARTDDPGNQHQQLDNLAVSVIEATRPVVPPFEITEPLGPALLARLVPGDPPLVPETIEVALNGDPVPHPWITTDARRGILLEIHPHEGWLFPSGSTQVVCIRAQTTLGSVRHYSRKAVIHPYASIPPDFGIPAPATNFPPPQFTGIRQSLGRVRLEWSGSGVLEGTTAGGAWLPVKSNSPAVLPAGESHRLFRVRR